MANDFATVLEERIQAGTAPAVVGLDPRPDALPNDLAPGDPVVDRIVAFYRETLPVLARHVPVVKPNIAFFERFGWEGFRGYQETCRLAKDAGMLVIGDIKRGDIGSTAAAYAAAPRYRVGCCCRRRRPPLNGASLSTVTSRIRSRPAMGRSTGFMGSVGRYQPRRSR